MSLTETIGAGTTRLLEDQVASMRRIEKLVDALRDALYALNHKPNFYIGHERFKDSYTLASQINKVLQP